MDFVDAINLFDNADFSRETRSNKKGGSMLRFSKGSAFDVGVDGTVFTGLLDCFFWVSDGVVVFGFGGLVFVLGDVVLSL